MTTIDIGDQKLVSYPALSLSYLVVVLSPIAFRQVDLVKDSARLSTLGLPAHPGLKVDGLETAALHGHNGGELVVVLDLVGNGLGGKVYFDFRSVIFG